MTTAEYKLSSEEMNRGETIFLGGEPFLLHVYRGQLLMTAFSAIIE